MSSQVRPWLVGVTLAGGLALMEMSKLALGGFSPSFEEGDFYPPGTWRIATFEDRLDLESADEQARLLSLPYAAAGGPPVAGSGVVIHDSQKAARGANLYVSGHAQEAILIDMDGVRLHRWTYPFEKAFPGRVPTSTQHDWRRVAWYGDGSLVALVQGGGLLKLDFRSRLQWTVDRGMYNDLEVLDDGRILALTKRARSIPELAPNRMVLEDLVVVIDAEGSITAEVSLLYSILHSDFASLLDPLADGSDILHTNTVEMISAEKRSIFADGHLLVSFRQLDAIVVIDPETARAVWALRGQWARQHQPSLLDDGNILLFDNQGANRDGERGRSRILELEPTSGEIQWSYEREGFYSYEAGSVQRLSNGNTLITSSEQGRAFEIERDGTVVWEFVSPHRAGVKIELVANLWDMIRIEDFEPNVFEERGVSVSR